MSGGLSLRAYERSSAPLCVGVKIGVMAKTLGTTVRALRYYESVGLLRPVRSARDRRYDATQCEKARLIVGLRRLGVPLGEIRQILDENAFGGDLDGAVSAVLVTLIAAKRAEAVEAENMLASLSA
ncbi:HTH-type transcriptional activator TipA [compost metagenome]